MRLALQTFALAAGGLAVLGLIGCGGSTAKPAETALVTIGGPVSGGATLGAEASAAGAPEQSTVAAPAGATQTIYCRDFTGPNHVVNAERAKDFAAAAPLPPEARGALGHFYVVHGETRSVLYHGFYETFDPAVDAEEAERAQRDHTIIEAMTVAGPAGEPVRAFPRAVFAPLERPDPPAPSEWNLENAPGYWTVAIGVYTVPAQRKQAAVESVAAAREAGVEAYYFHGDSQSYVCVGTWPKAAARQTVQGDYPEMHQIDPNDPPPVIVSTTPLSEAARNLRDRRGRRVHALEIGLEISDASLRQTMKQYDYDVDGLRGQEEPLLLEIPEVTGRPTEITGELRDNGPTADPLRKKDMDALLNRAGGL